MNTSLRPVFLVALLLIPLLCVGAQTYWDEIELIDGQVLRGVVVDTIKDNKVIQLTTRDFISLPASSVIRSVTAQERRREAEAKLSLPPVKVDLSLSVVTMASPTWKFAWGATPYQPSQSLGIELEDGQSFEANWLETSRGQAILLLADGQVLSLDRSAIRRVTGVLAPSSAPVAVAAVPAVEPKHLPDLITPVLTGISRSLEATFAGPPGDDPSPFRGFFLPTARLAVPGHLNVHQLDGAATQLTLGFTDYFQAQASSVLPTLAASDLPSFCQAGAQVALPLTLGGTEALASWVSLGQWAGGLRSNKIWSDPSFLPFVNATVRRETGGAAFEATALAGYNVRPRPHSAQLVWGGTARIDPAPGFAVLAEGITANTLEENTEGRTSLALGIRLWHRDVALDLGAQGVLQSLWEDKWVNSWWNGWNEKVRKDTVEVYPMAHLSLRF